MLSGSKSSSFDAFAYAVVGTVVIRIWPRMKPLYCHRLKAWLDDNEAGTVFWNRNSLIWADNCL